jgi:hypothetical protein
MTQWADFVAKVGAGAISGANFSRRLKSDFDFGGKMKWYADGMRFLNHNSSRCLTN